MTVTQTSRFRLTSWGTGLDPFNRTQRQSDNQQIENYGAIDQQGTLAARSGAYAVRGAWYYATDTDQLFRHDGTTWRQVYPSAKGSPTSQAPGDTSVQGVSALNAAADHKHALPPWATSAQPLTPSGLSIPGSDNTFARGGHAHALPNTIAYRDQANTWTAGQDFPDAKVGARSLPRGLVAYASPTNSADINGPTGANEATILSTSFTPVQGRKYRISARAAFTRDDILSDSVILRFRTSGPTGTELSSEAYVLPSSFIATAVTPELFVAGGSTTDTTPAANSPKSIASGNPITIAWTWVKVSGTGSSPHYLSAIAAHLAIFDVGT